MIQTDLTQEKISVEQLLAEPAPSEHGAQIVFTGIVRNHNQGKKVLGVSYDAQQPLARRAFLDIAGEALAKWGPDLAIRIVHRFGRLAVGEASLVVIVSSRHRDESYQASRYLLEELKHRAPIWKKEHYEQGDSEWLEGHALCGHDHRTQNSQMPEAHA